MTSLFDTSYQVVISSDDSQIAFDATVTEQHKHELAITEHPVEDGANVADHARKLPDAIDIQGIISNHPILLNFTEDLQPSVPGGDPNNRAQDAYDEFVRLQSTAALLDVTTELRDYTDMMITAISVRRDKTTRDILDIGLTLREFRKATVESTEAPEPVEPVHKGKTNKGRQQKKDPAPEVEEKSESVLESAANALDKIRGGA